MYFTPDDTINAHKLLVDFFVTYPSCEEDEKFNSLILNATLTQLVTNLIENYKALKAKE